MLAQSNWPPSFNDRRFKENWILEDWTLKDSLSRNFSDRWKLIALSNNRNIWMSVGGQLRLRYQGTFNQEFVDKYYGEYTLRARLHADVHFGRNFRVFAEGIYSNAVDQGNTRLGVNTPVKDGAILNLFGEYTFNINSDWQTEVWVGRRELQAGYERFVSPGNWLNTRRSWDGFGINIGRNSNQISAFISKPVIVIPDGFTQRDADAVFWGIRYQNDEVVYNMSSGYGVPSWSNYQKIHFEPYLFGLDRQQVVYEQGTQDDKRYTLGVLFSGPIRNSHLDYELEVAYQDGSFGSADISAYSITLELGYNPRVFWQPRFWLGFDYASGDNNPNDNKLGTFDPLFPQATAWFGEHGTIDRKNLVSYSFNIDLRPLDIITTRLSYWNFSRAQVNDAVYNTANGILRSPMGSTARDLGNSVQISNIIKPTFQWEFNVTYNFWIPGKFFEETQNTEALTQHYLMLTAQYSF